MTANHNVTFITHEATRTGAPGVLLTLMRWLRANTDIRVSTLAVYPGPLLRQFKALGPVVELNGDWRHFLFLQRGIRLARHMTTGKDDPLDSFVHRAAGTSLWLAKARQLKRLGECDLIYANSVQSAWGVRSILSRAPLLSHLHELEDALLDPYERPNVATMCGRRARHVIVPAMAVRDLLVNKIGVPPSKISVRYPFIEVPASRPDPSLRSAIRRKLEIPENAVVVGMCGQFILRKSPDRFIDIAARVIRESNGAPVYFVWIGGQENLEYGRYMMMDIRRLGIADRFRHVTEQINPRPYLTALDIFLLSSRSDPFPLVCLETAAYAEAPIVCFEQAGGMPELVGRDCGVVVPYLDTVAAAEAVLGLVNDPVRRHELGANAAERVRTNHNVARSAPAIGALISEVIAGRTIGSDAPNPAASAAAPPPVRSAAAAVSAVSAPALGALEKGGNSHGAAPLIFAE